MQPNKDRRQNPKQIGLTTKQLIKRTRRITTVEDILARDDVNGILADLEKVKPDISDLVVIYLNRSDKRYHAQFTDSTLESTAVWMLENVKLDILNNEVE